MVQTINMAVVLRVIFILECENPIEIKMTMVPVEAGSWSISSMVSGGSVSALARGGARAKKFS